MPEQARFSGQGGDSKICDPKALIPLLFALLMPCSLSAAYEGFGTTTQAGNEGQVIEVTSLEDSGEGTLREALKKEDIPRRIVFRVSGTIHLQRPLKIKEQSFLTIDGSTGPAPGITLESNSLYIEDSHDVLVTHIRVRRSQGDGITVRRSSRIVVDHCSLTDSSDENIGITQDTHDMTVSWCIIGDTRSDSKRLKPKGVLIANFDRPGVANISLHHNLFINESQRNPQVSQTGTVDIRNNLIWHWQAYGIRLRRGAQGNIIGNVFKTEVNAKNAILLKEGPGQVYIGGNKGPGNLNVNKLSTANSPFAVATVSTDLPEVVEQKVLQGAGAFPRDAIDHALVGLPPLDPTKQQQEAEHTPDLPQPHEEENTVVSGSAEKKLESTDSPRQEYAP